MTKRLTGINPLAYSGVEASTPPNSVQIRRAPTTQDYFGFNVGDIWINIAGYPQTLPTAEDIYYLVAKVNHVATWVALAGTNALETLTGNSGGPVPGDVNDNINVVGDAVTINIAGNPGTNTLTASTTGAVATSYPADVGIAVPAAGVLDVFGGTSTAGSATNINTRGTGNLLEINLNNSIYQPSTDITGASGMYSLGSSANILTDRFLHNFGTLNTFVGTAAGNTTLTTGSAVNNTAVGASALTSVTTAAACTAIGSVSLASMISGNTNTALGAASGRFLTTGVHNVLIGGDAGLFYTGAESYNICIGTSTAGILGESNALRIGGGTGTGVNLIDKAFIAGIRGITPAVNDAIPVLIDSAGQLGTISSSLRFKENVKDMSDSSSGIMKLRPTIFNYKADAKKHTHYGLIAEEVLEVMPDLVVHDQMGPFTVKYNDLIPMLLNEIQKLNKRIEKLEKKKV